MVKDHIRKIADMIMESPNSVIEDDKAIMLAEKMVEIGLKLVLGIVMAKFPNDAENDRATTGREGRDSKAILEWEGVKYRVSMYSACVDARDGMVESAKRYDAEARRYGRELFERTCHKKNAWKAQMSDNQNADKYCCCCGEDFPVAEEPAAWTMGQLRSLDHAMAEVRYMFRHALDGSHGGGYLCGNCYFDITDEEDEDET